jgi:hypothetical protein
VFRGRLGIEHHPVDAQRSEGGSQDRDGGRERAAAVREWTVERRALRGVHAALCAGHVSDERQRPRRRDRQRRIADQPVMAQDVQPSADGQQPAGADEFRRVPVDQAGGRDGVATREPVLDRLLRLTLLLVPVGGAPVHPRLLAGLAAPELGQQHLGHQAVVAVPLAAPVQRDDEQVPSRRLGQPVRGTALGEHVVAECAGHLVERGRTRQELRRLRSLPGEKLVPEVLREVRVVPGQPSCRGGGIRRGPDGPGGEIDAGRPALGALDERVDGVVRGVNAGVGQDRPGLLLRERQGLDTELDGPVLAAQPAEAEHQPGRHRELETRREAGGEGADEVHRRDVAQLVEIVEHQDAPPVPVPQGRQEVAERRQVPGPVADRKGPEHRGVQRPDAVQRQSDVAGQADRVPIGLVDGHPGELPGVRSRPLAQRGRLPVSRRRGHLDERDALGCRGEGLHQPGTRDQARTVDGAFDLRPDRGERQLPARAAYHPPSSVARRPRASAAVVCRRRTPRG